MIREKEKGYIGLEPLSKAILICVSLVFAGLLCAASVAMLIRCEKADIATAIVFADNAAAFAKELLGATVVPTLISELILMKTGCKEPKSGK